MGKTERRNVSQKKRSPVRTTLKLRKEKKMKGGELTEGDVNNIKNRDKESLGGTLEIVDALLDNLKDMKTNLDKPEYINQVSNQTDKEKFKTDITNFVNNEGSNIINMINKYFENSPSLDFSKKYTETIKKVIPILEYILGFLEKRIKIPSSINPNNYNPFKSLYNRLKKNVVEVIQIMEAIAEGAEIKIAPEDADTAIPTIVADTGELGATVGLTTGKSNTNITNVADKSNDESGPITSTIVADTGELGATVGLTTGKSDTAATDTNEMIDKLKRGLDIIYRIYNSSIGINANDQQSLSEKLNPIERVINGYLIHIDKEGKAELNELVKKHRDPHIPFFTSKDIGRLLNGELIITEQDILYARNSLNELKSNVKNDPNSLENKVIKNSQTHSTIRPEYKLTKETFEENINFLIKLLNEIEKKVKKESQDTTSETEDTSNTDTNVIKEINDITIDSDEELVTLNITDQEGHIIYSYILKFTRKGDTSASASGSDSDSDKSEESKVINRQQGTNVSDSASGSDNESESDSDSNVSERRMDTTGSDSAKSVNEDTTINVSNESVDTSKSASSELLKKNTGLPPFTQLAEIRHFGGGRDPINDQYTIPKTVLTARMNEPFSIDDNSFIISN